MSEINCNNCAVSDFKESLCDRCDEMKRLGSAEDIEGLLIKAFSEVDSLAKSDCIERQAAIDAVNEWLKLYVINRTMSNITSIQDILRHLPSAQPEITEKQIAEYCRKRNLVLITHESYEILKAYYDRQNSV